MQPFTCVRGPAAPLPASNVDTDVIMPKQFLKGVDREGLDRGTFYDLRFDARGLPDPAFILNRPPWIEAKFLVVGPNFGCGSSREHAVWGLAQLGIRALIGSSFAGIFNDNCLRNGILTVTLPPPTIEALMTQVQNPEAAELTVDLPEQTIAGKRGGVISFAIDPLRKESLLRGLDAVSATLGAYADDIHVFEQRYQQENPWLG